VNWNSVVAVVTRLQAGQPRSHDSNFWQG